MLAILRKMITFAPMKLHAPLFPLTLCLTAGIALSTLLSNWPTGVALLSVMMLFTGLLSRAPKWQSAALGMCMLFLGMTLGKRHEQQLDIRWPTGVSTIDVVVTGEPIVKDRWVVLEVLSAERHHQLRVHVERDAESERIQIGDGLTIQGRIQAIHDWRQGHFDYRRYMQCHGFVGETFLHPHQWQWYATPLSGLSVIERWQLRMLCWRHTLLERYRQWGVADDAYGVIAAMTLGDKTHLDHQIKETYSRVGASHVLALSGLHLTIIYGIVSLLIGWGRRRMLSQVVTILALWAYAILVGLSPSVTRSAYMLSIIALMSVGHRERMSLNTLTFTAVLMLAVNPYSLYDIGFQLSFMALLAIFTFHPLVNTLIPLDVQQRHRFLRYLWSMTTLSFAAQIGTAPLVAYYFGRFSVYFLLTNFFVIPLASVVLYLSLICLVTSWWPVLQAPFIKAVSLIVILLNSLLTRVALLPGCSIEGIRLSTIQLALVYVIIVSTYVWLSVVLKTGKRQIYLAFSAFLHTFARALSVKR